jgi:hypothetical protein
MSEKLAIYLEPQETTRFFWDCNCDTDYIHPYTKSYCLVCGATPEDQPDSILVEVVEWMRKQENSNNSLPIPNQIDVMVRITGNSQDDIWEEYDKHSRSSWVQEVENGDTSLGYWEWVESQIEQDDY